ncbi:unnamed protein product [Thelazia callipaeda]|uniref:Hydroxysteroid dehydrogenase-like protein 2 n=1 Tax=Thelazia callipaeda TaxID=103827 RepID=A0A0N5CME0_THECL|nr:unnamed protein product [Thelazia callipaeda]
MRNFAGRTVLITGASRGIGKEIALKLARDGANIVVAAKTTEVNPKLPGTIYSAVEDIEKAGGKGLACVVDVRDEQTITKAVYGTVKKFGGIDVLINNASAISLAGTLRTTVEKFDLMHQINARGTFLMSQKCIPFLKKGTNPHILNISPPLTMTKQWFANHVAYTMAKYSMSMCVLGMHEELRPFKIAVNALWPKTAIWTTAMEILSNGTAENQCRKPTIMADAAYAILSRDSTTYTGNFAIDEYVLREEGIRDFDHYPNKHVFDLPNTCSDVFFNFISKMDHRIVSSGVPLLQDFFIPDDAKEATNLETPVPNSVLNVIIDKIKLLITSDVVQKVQAICRLDIETNAVLISGSDIHHVYIDMKNRAEVYESESDNEDVDVHLTTDLHTLSKLFNSKISATAAFASGKLKINGNMEKAIILLSQIVKP